METKTIENVLLQYLAKTRERLAEANETRQNDPQMNKIKGVVAQRLGLPPDTSLPEVVSKLKSLSKEDKKKALDNIINEL